MWCEHCQQDVPRVYSFQTGGYLCLRCGAAQNVQSTTEEAGVTAPPSPLPGQHGSDTEPAEASTEKANSPGQDEIDLVPGDFWELEERLRHIERLVAEAPTLGREASHAQPRNFRVDSAHRHPGVPHGRADTRSPRRPRVRGDRFSALFTWPIVALGIMSTVCGAVLEGWAVLAARPELSNYGIPIAFCGMVVLLIGMLLQMERLGEVSESASQELEKVDRLLTDLRWSSTRVDEAESPPAPDVHRAGHLPPDALLSELQHRLDNLADRMSEGG